MDDRRFDSLAKSLATGVKRRSVIKSVLGLGAAALGGSTIASVDAARRPAPAPKPISCPGQQHWDTTNGCICPNGNTKCGPDCCPDGMATCCDNACCYGVCYGEELCCDTTQWCDLTGECCGAGEVCCGIQGCIPAGDIECCADAECGENQYCDSANQCACNEGAVPCGDSCIVGQCCTTDDCGEGQVCAGGGCFTPCTYDNGNYSCPQCDAWQCLVYLVDNSSFCVALGAAECDHGMCPNGSYCVHGTCMQACS